MAKENEVVEYARKQSKARAVRFDGDNIRAIAEFAGCSFKDRIEVRGRRCGARFSSPWGSICVYIGEWVVMREGRPDVYADAAFRKEYDIPEPPKPVLSVVALTVRVKVPYGTSTGIVVDGVRRAIDDSDFGQHGVEVLLGNDFVNGG